MSDIELIVSRCQDIGWPVEFGSNSNWRYRITMANGKRVQIHGTPRDRNWQTVVFQELRRGGFAAAEAAWLTEQEERRLSRINDDRRRGGIDTAFELR